MILHRSKQSKIDHLQAFIEDSDAVKRNLDLPRGKWASVLSDLSEDQIDDLLLMLKEESEMKVENKHEKERKLSVNETSFLNRLEQLKFSAESLTDNQKQ